jgi:hypothetical protein
MRVLRGTLAIPHILDENLAALMRRYAGTSRYSRCSRTFSTNTSPRQCVATRVLRDTIAAHAPRAPPPDREPRVATRTTRRRRVGHTRASRSRSVRVVPRATPRRRGDPWTAILDLSAVGRFSRPCVRRRLEMVVCETIVTYESFTLRAGGRPRMSSAIARSCDCLAIIPFARVFLARSPSPVSVKIDCRGRGARNNVRRITFCTCRAEAVVVAARGHCRVRLPSCRMLYCQPNRKSSVAYSARFRTEPERRMIVRWSIPVVVLRCDPSMPSDHIIA